MIIHVVKEGDTIESIAEAYGVPASQIIRENEITNADNLLPGQDLVIQYTAVTHTVAPGDTLYSIAELYNVSVIHILQNNPGLSNATTLYPGQTIVIDYNNEKIGSLSVTGYAYPYINRETLIKTLPYLTYLTIFTYGFTPTGELVTIDDVSTINLAREYGVAPIMLISTLTPEGTFSNALAHTLLNNETVQDTLIDNIITNMQEKNYYGLDVDFEFIYPEDADAYVAFINKLRERLNAVGFEVMVALAPKISSDQPGTLYEGHDYAALGAAANSVLLMTYEWGYTYGPPMAVAPINKVREVLDYGVSQIPASKIFMGIPNYGYDWTLPYVKGTSAAKSLGNVAAVDLALEYNAPIQFDTTSQAPFFNYTDADGKEHQVWFEDARSIEAKIRLVPEYGFQGAAYWNIMRYFPANWLVVNALMDINKVL